MAEIEADDLLIEILFRVPAYSVDRFKSTCRQWHSLISNPGFLVQWRKRNIKRATGLVLQHYNSDSGGNGPMRYIPFSSDNSNNTIPASLRKFYEAKQSCNGLFLCRFGYGKYHIFNSTTNVYFALKHPGPKSYDKKYGMSLAFDPKKSPHYKAISCHGLYGSCLVFHIYFSSTGCWTGGIYKHKIPETEECSSFIWDVSDYNCYWGSGVYWNGSIHWRGAKFYFNVETQTLREMPPWPDCSISSPDDYFGESCGRLSITRIRGSPPCVMVYGLKRDYSQWVLRYSVSLENHHSFNISVLSVVHGAEEDDSFLVLRIDSTLVRYNHVSKSSEKLCALFKDRHYLSFHCFESLSCD